MGLLSAWLVLALSVLMLFGFVIFMVWLLAGVVVFGNVGLDFSSVDIFWRIF